MFQRDLTMCSIDFYVFNSLYLLFYIGLYSSRKANQCHIHNAAPMDWHVCNRDKCGGKCIQGRGQHAEIHNIAIGWRSRIRIYTPNCTHIGAGLLFFFHIQRQCIFESFKKVKMWLKFCTSMELYKGIGQLLSHVMSNGALPLTYCTCHEYPACLAVLRAQSHLICISCSAETRP